MNFSIIINTHNQSKYLGECINSCINQNFINYEIIVVDSSKKPFLNKFKDNKKLRYFHIKEKSKKFPVINQMYQVYYGFKKSRGKYICLLDGDDKFSPLKLKNLSSQFNDTKDELVQDTPILFWHNSKQKLKEKNYKKNIFFKKFLINWPQIFGTSTITCNRKILNSFFKTGKPFKWEFLAIDAKLILFAEKKYKIRILNYEFTFKRIHGNNLDKTYSSFFSKSFWIRRKMQIDYDYFLSGKRLFNFDNFVTKIVNFFL